MMSTQTLFVIISLVNVALASLPPHPRLILSDSRLADIKSFIGNDTSAASYYALLVAKGEYILTQAPVPQPPDGTVGNYLLQARNVQQRVYTTALLYRLTGNATWAARAREELLNCSQWTSWNAIEHTLDMAEFAQTVAIGLDWLYDYLSAEDKAVMTTGIVQNAFSMYYEAYTKNPSWAAGWIATSNNWCQVVNGGGIVAALGFLGEPDVPDYVENLVLPYAMKDIKTSIAYYAPDGSWIEGPIYHGYATRYLVPAIASLFTAGLTDEAESLLSMSGLASTSEFPVHSFSNAWRFFNWADASEHPEYESHQLYFASEFGNLGAAFSVRALADTHYIAVDDNTTAAMIFPTSLLYYTPEGTLQDRNQLPLARLWNHTDVVTVRSSWTDPNATFIGWKGGDATWGHSHLDLGSFVFESDGQRFASDLGPDNYSLPGYFDFSGPRFKYYRIGSWGHNVVMFNHQNQDHTKAARHLFFNVSDASAAPKDVVADAWGVVNLTDAYAYQHLCSTVYRGLASLQGNAQLLVVDEFAPASSAALGTVTWQMHTYGAVTIDATGTTAQIDVAGVTATLALLPETACPGAAFTVHTVALPPPQYPTTGLSRIELNGNVETCRKIIVTLGVNPATDFGVQPLAAWQANGPVF